MQAHLKAAQANAKPKLLKELAKPTVDSEVLRNRQLRQHPKILVTVIPKHVRAHHRKYPADVETKAETAVALPLIGGLGNKLRFGHARTVGEMQLKYMPASFNVKANGKRVGKLDLIFRNTISIGA